MGSYTENIVKELCLISRLLQLGAPLRLGAQGKLPPCPPLSALMVLIAHINT